MPIPYTPIIDLLNCFICAFCSYKLYQSYQRDRGSIILLYFSRGYSALIVSYLFFSVPRLIWPDDSLLLGISFIIAQAFLYLAIAYFGRVTVSFFSPRRARSVFWIIVFASIIAVTLSVIYFGYPHYDIETSITQWDIHPVVSIASVVIFAGVLLPSMVFFFWQGLRSRDRTVRVRSIVISIGLLFLTVTAYTYYTATTKTVALVSDVFSLLSFLIIFIGIIYKRSMKEIKADNLIR